MVLGESAAEKGAEVVNLMFERGYLTNFAGNVVLRLAAPLTVSFTEIDRLMGGLAEVITEVVG